MCLWSTPITTAGVDFEFDFLIVGALTDRFGCLAQFNHPDLCLPARGLRFLGWWPRVPVLQLNLINYGRLGDP